MLKNMSNVIHAKDLTLIWKKKQAQGSLIWNAKFVLPAEQFKQFQQDLLLLREVREEKKGNE